MISSVAGAVGSFFSTARWMWSHPLASRNRTGALARWTRWQLGSRLLQGAAVLPYVNDTVMIVDPGMTGATGNVYVGLHEFHEMAFLLHCLRASDWFLDVGANVGSYTILAAGVCGSHTLAIEPVPTTFARLCANVRLNGLDDRVRPMNIGIASKPGRLHFTHTLDTVNHVLTSDEANPVDAITVDVVTLDELVADRVPLLAKIDVEGFETEVIAGAGRVLAAPELRALIVELNGSGARYGFDEARLRDRIESFGFRPYDYDPFARTLRPSTAVKTEGNTLYVRDVAFVQERLKAGPSVRVVGVEL